MGGEMIAVVAMGGAACMSALAAGVFLMMKSQSPPGSSPGSSPGTGSSPGGGESLTTFGPDQQVRITKDGKAIGYVFNEKNKDNMCDIAYPGNGAFMLTKSGSTYAIKVNCDGDGKWTSYLADDARDMIQPKRTAAKHAWTIACPSAAQGCSIQATKSNKKYVAPAAGASGGMTLAGEPTYWTFANSEG